MRCTHMKSMQSMKSMNKNPPIAGGLDITGLKALFLIDFGHEKRIVWS